MGKSSLKEKLIGSLGVFGYIIWYIIAFVFAFAPLWVLNLPWWADMLIVAVIMFLPIIGALCNIGIWIWSFFVAIITPINAFVVIYFIVLTIYVIIYIIPILISIFSRR
jgi:hypothetical protein